MRVQFTDPSYLWLLLPAVTWILWFAFRSDNQADPWRRWTSLGIRLTIVFGLVCALAGLQALHPIQGMNLFFVLDRSQSIPPDQQELARDFVNRASQLKKKEDQAGVIVFGSEASIESTPNVAVDLQKVQAVVGTERTDLSAAIRLGTAAFPETGQKRLVLLTDANENIGDALAAAMAARSLGVSIDVFPIGTARASDVSVQRIELPSRVKQGQSLDTKIFIESEIATKALVRLYQNEQFLGEQAVDLEPGKNLFSFPQRLSAPGFYGYDVRVDAPGDSLLQNNRASSFTAVQGEPRVLVVCQDPSQEESLVASLTASQLQTKVVPAGRFPGTLAELQSYDSIFLCNVAAGDLGAQGQKLLEAAIRDYGVGVVAIGGDQSFTAGGYRGTPLETLLPVNMELDSKKVVPSGAVVLIMHGMEFNNGNAVARDCAQGVLDALGPRDELGVVLWDGTERWLFPLSMVGDKTAARNKIAGMEQGDLGSFQNVLKMAEEALVKSKANLKHIIVFSDGDPGAPTRELMESIVGNRITVSTVLIAGHFGPETMIFMAEAGKGRFYNVSSPYDLPQIFLKETAVILKTAIIEEEFSPRLRSRTELVRGIDSCPPLLGYVATTPKPRAELPLTTTKDDPLLAHWQYGLGRAVAFTSDAKARWARNWIGWPQYRQFWSQIAQWSLRRLENADFSVSATVDKGSGLLQVEALDERGDYRNFLNLQAVISSPAGERQTLRVEQKGPGFYEAKFQALETGSYLINVMEIAQGRTRSSQVVGAAVSYSPEFESSGPNWSLLNSLARAGGGKVLESTMPAANPFAHDRHKTYQPANLWEWLLKLAVILFVLDVGVRRVQVGRDELARAWAIIRRRIPGLQPPPARSDESLATLLERRKGARASTAPPAASEELFKSTTQIQTSTPQEITPEASAPAPPSSPPPRAPQGLSPESTTSRLLAARRRAQQSERKNK